MTLGWDTGYMAIYGYSLDMGPEQPWPGPVQILTLYQGI